MNHYAYHLLYLILGVSTLCARQAEAQFAVKTAELSNSYVVTGVAQCLNQTRFLLDTEVPARLLDSSTLALLLGTNTLERQQFLRNVAQYIKSPRLRSNGEPITTVDQAQLICRRQSSSLFTIYYPCCGQSYQEVDF